MRDFLRHLFLPHHTNNHRPKVLHNHSLFVVCAVLLLLALGVHSINREYPSVLGVSANMTVEDLLKITNQKREEKGLAPLKLDAALSRAAAQKAQHMYDKNYWAHVSPEGTTPWVFIKNSGYEYLYAGENLARGFTTAPDVVDAWMESPTHRDNMLSANYEDIGFAIQSGSLTGSDTVLVVEMFGSKYIATNQPAIPSIPPIADVVPSPATQSPTNIEPTSPIAVAAVQNNPLIDSKSTTRNISLILLISFIVILILDAIIIERKKIARVVSHNVDHILFLTILLLAAIIIGKGAIL